MEKWVLLRKGADFKGIGERFHISPRLAALIRNRDVIGDEAIQSYLNGSIADLYDGMLMKDMDKAIEIIDEKIKEEKKIRIIGDYDIDGVCATYILLEGLRNIGAKADSDIPDRIKDGYGLNRQLVDRAATAGVDTIITCDNGIAAAEEIAYAREQGMTVIVTDHHEVPYIEEGAGRRYCLPPADAVIDPKQEGCMYPFKGLCGAAVAYKLIEALHEVMGQDVSDMDYLMEVVAVATIGDVMELRGENRIFVRQGLEMLRRSQNMGLNALIECTGIDPERLSSYHIGFVIGPCLNAGGRLDSAKRALELLCAVTKEQADRLAGDLKALNDSRKEMTIRAVAEAVRQIESTKLIEDKILVVYLPDCHESLAGIVAGRLREKYYRPVIVLTDSEDGVKGSGRSIESYHMYEALHKCRHLLSKFGGHELAAGLSLMPDQIEVFRKYINEINELPEEAFVQKVSIDMKLGIKQMTEEFISELNRLEPFGKGNPKPIFAESDFRVLNGRILGKNQNVLKLQVADREENQIEAMYFGDIERILNYMEQKSGGVLQEDILSGRAGNLKMSFTFYPDINIYMGRKNIQIIVQNYQ